MAEIENLRKEATALKEIRQSMGTDEFSRRIFEKVFVDDINRLREMEDMWKSRSKPEPLDYDEISQLATTVDTPSTAQNDQSSWDLAQNFAVFTDSLKRLTIRMAEAQQIANAAAEPAVLSFDKDDKDTLDFVASTANLRAIIFGIEPKSEFDIKQMAGNIIPAIATTNAMVAGLCVLQAFKVLRQDLKKARNVFLERSTARVINSEALRPPNPDCSVCEIASSKLVIDPARATLNDLVEGVLKTDLGYGEEFSVNNEVGTLYDPDLDDNLGKKFSDLGVKGDSFLTIIDEDDDPRVNVSLSISEQALPEDAKPVQLPEVLEIARKPKKAADLVDGHNHTDGVKPPEPNTNGVTKRESDPETAPPLSDAATNKRKRDFDGDDIGNDVQKLKKGRVNNVANDDGVLLINDGDDTSGGAIVIDD